jgi:prophage antirepressor-like protein
MENIEIHKEGDLFCLNDIAAKLINSKNVKEFVKKIDGKKLINGNYYVSYEIMKNLLSKSKSIKARQYLEYINKNNDNEDENKEIEIDKDIIIVKNNKKHITTKEQLLDKSNNRKFVDFGSNNILYENKKILFFDYNENIYFKGKDICDLLNYEDHKKALNNHVDKEDFFIFTNLNNYEEVKEGEGGVKRPPLSPTYSPKETKKLHKIKLDLENKINQVIDDNTIFINESGLYSLILSSKLSKAKEFKKWVTNDVLISIRKTGSYDKNQNKIYYDDTKIKELNNENCVYIIKVKDSLYKFGITSHLKVRMYNHKRFLEYDEIFEIFTFPNLNIALNIENKIKQYASNCKIRKFIESVGNEFFETNQHYTIERILNEIKIFVNDELDRCERIENKNKFDGFLLIENQKVKQYELELKKYEYMESIRNFDFQIEAEKTKMETEKTKQLEILEKTKQLQIELDMLKVKNAQKNIIIEKTNKCQDCNTLIALQSKRCNKCENKNRINKSLLTSTKPTLEQLNKDLKKLGSYVQVGIKYNVSDNCIRKWIRKYQNLT